MDFEQAEKDHKIALERLTLKVEELAIKVVQDQKEQDEVRDNLAKWQRELEEKEKNLLVREEHVELAHKRMARNSNLLKM